MLLNLLHWCNKQVENKGKLKKKSWILCFLVQVHSIALWSAQPSHTLRECAFCGKCYVSERVFIGPAAWGSWGNRTTGRCCCSPSCGRSRMWGRFRPLGRWRRTRTWRWCTPACRSPRGCTGAQSRRWWRWCGGAPSPELRRGSWTGRPRAPSAPSPTPSWTSDPETPPGRRSPGPSSSPSCLRRWPWTRKGRSCCCWRRWSWRQRWRWAGWRRRWSVAGRPRWWRGRGGRGTRRPRRSPSPDLRESCRWAGGQPGWTPVALSPSGGWRYRSAGRTSRPPADRFPGKRRGEKEKVALAWPLDNAAICAGWEYGLTSEIHPSIRGKLTAWRVSVSSRLLLRHFAAACLFLSLRILFFSSSSGDICT